MKFEDKEHFAIIGESFAAWYKQEIESFVARCDLSDGETEDQLANKVVTKVAQFTLGRLTTELKSVGVTPESIIKFLKKQPSFWEKHPWKKDEKRHH